MEIRVLGDFQIAHEILLGVARLFSDPDGALVNNAPAALLSAFLLYSFLKWAMDNEKNPFPAKEFIFGIVFWLIFGGGPMSPKYTVELTSIRENRFEVVDDVPFLAAIPSWLASNFFAEARRIMEDNFGPLHYTKSADDRAQDPLSALIKMYDSGDALLIDPYLTKSIQTYMVDCYAVEQSLTGTSLTVTRKELDTIPIQNVWNGVEVSYNFLTAQYYTQANNNGVETPCPTIWQAIKTEVFTNGSPFVIKLKNVNEAKGVTEGAIEDASAMIYAASTSHTSPTPLEIQQGLFLSYAMRDGLSRTNMESWADKMMFEAQRKRVIENAGERNMFLQLMIPIITAIETFSFFIAPVMMVLAVLGGHGLALIIKYLMLVLFINLWGFVKVFVDLFTAISVERAFQATMSTDPFAFGAYANTFNEIEGFLSVASSMTVAIPMFAMFLLYGGVHSVMGVMRTLGGGSVDGNMAAPTMGSSMNGGVFHQGDTTYTQMTGSGNFATTHTTGSNAATGTGIVSNTTSGSFANTSATAEQEVRSSMNAWQQTATQAFGTQNAVTSQQSGGKAIDFSTLSLAQQAASIAKQLQDSGGMSASESQQAVADIMASGGASFNLGGQLGLGGKLNKLSASAGVDAKAQTSYKAGLSEARVQNAQKAASILNNWGESDTYSSSGRNATTYTNINSETNSASNDNSTALIRSASEQLNKSVAVQAAVSNDVSKQAAIGQNSNINWTALDGATRNATTQSLDAMYAQLTKNPEAKSRLDALGIGNTDELMMLTQQTSSNGWSFAANVQTLEKMLGGRDGNLSQSAADHRLLSSVYGYSSSLISDEHKVGFLSAQQAHQSIANTIDGVNTTDQSLQGPTTGNVPTTAAVQQQAREVQADVRTQQANQPTPEAKKDAVVAAANESATQTGKPATLDAQGNTVNNVQQQPNQEWSDLRQIVDKFKNPIFSPEALENGRKLLNAGTSAVNTLGDWTSGWYSADRVWGQDAEKRAESVNSLFLQQGSASLAAEQGFRKLMSAGTPEIKDAFIQRNEDGTKLIGSAPNATAYAMNDAIKLLQTPEGQKFIASIPDGDDKNRFLENVGSAYKEMQNLTVEQRGQMDAISTNRINGTLPTTAADVLIANSNQKDGSVPLMQNETWFSSNIPGYGYEWTQGGTQNLDATRATALLVANTEALNSNPIIKEMAGYKGGEKIPDIDGGAGRRAYDTAKDMIVADEVNRVLDSGSYNFKAGTETGTNMAFTEKDLKEGFSSIISQGGNAQFGVYENMVRGDTVSAAGTAALFNSGVGSLATRLDAAGFDGAAEQAKDFASANAARAVNWGVVTTESQRESLREIGKAVVDNRDVPNELLENVAPAVYFNNQIFSKESSNADKSTSPNLAQGHTVANMDGSKNQTSIAVAESEDRRVLFRGESTFSSISGDNGSIQAAGRMADAEAMRAVEVSAIHDTFMNKAFNELNKNGGIPESFTSETKQTYTKVSTDAAGVVTYNGGDNGMFTYTPGDDRLMPTADNPNYMPLSDVVEGKFTDGTTKYSSKHNDPLVPDMKK